MPPQSPPAAEPSATKTPRSPWTWAAIIAIPLILAASFGSYFLLAAPIPDPPAASSGLSEREIAAQRLEIARLQAEARRNALATGAGFGALVALIVSIRRQHHHEKSTAVAEDDALQRRITDARIRAVEQLGSDNPAVRIGGLHNLERIGQQHAELRQVVLDEICSYLRLPYAPPSPAQEPKVERLAIRQFEPIGPPPVEPESTNDESEREVRLIAQEILQRHLYPAKQDQFWEHARLNLRNAHLDNIHLSGCRLNHADFRGATFTDRADFKEATFTDRADFAGATFTSNTDFARATFTGNADFEGATFTGDAYFTHATFTGAIFPAFAFFLDATFTGDAYFARATFTSNTYFARATFTGDADFAGATFTGDADFAGATFTSTIRLHSRWEPTELRESSPALVERLQELGIRLRIEAEHLLPEGWGLEPIPGEPGWGRLTRQAPTPQE